jgi:hypothetical protein
MLNLYRKHKLLVSIAGGLFVIVFIIILSRCVPNGILAIPTQTPTSQYLDTPTLINQAFDRGEITEEERLLYLAYALYEYKSLPPQYLSSVGWFGDAAVGELIKAVNSPAKFCSISPHIRSELLRLVKKTDVDTICN